MTDAIVTKVLKNDRLFWSKTLLLNIFLSWILFISIIYYLIKISLLLSCLLFPTLSKDMRKFLFLCIKSFNWFSWNFFESWWLLFLCCILPSGASARSRRIQPAAHSLLWRSCKLWWAFRLYYTCLWQYYSFSVNFLRIAPTDLLFILSFCNC